MTAKDRLKEMGISLPEPPQPADPIPEPCEAATGFLYRDSSPLVRGVIQYGGVVGGDITADQGASGPHLRAECP